MSDKDFLSQFSGKDNVPESFRQEERKPVNKQRKPINKVVIIVLCALLLIAALVVYLVFFAPKIEMPNFEGKTKTDVAAWVKQQGIQTSGIIFEEDYYFDYDENVIISQSIEAGKKVKENVKLTFVSSLGADPDELIKTPDLMNMTKAEIQDWISKNKLTKTKVTTAYSDEVEEGNVISFAYSGCDEDTFTRSSTLKISVSKGPAPAGTIAVEDFVKQDFSIVEAWGKKNGIVIEKVTNYSDKILKDAVISQSIEAKKTIKEGDTLTVVVSLGKGIKVPDFTLMSDDEVDEWIKENSLYCKVKEMYSETSAYVLEQSIKANSYISEDSKLTLTLNLGSHFYLDDLESLMGISIVGESYDRFKEIAENLNDKGLYIDTHRNPIDSNEPYGKILSINKIYSGTTEYSELQKLPLEVDITVNISNGKLSKMVKIPYESFIGKEVSELDDWILVNHDYEITYTASGNGTINSIQYDEKQIQYYDGYVPYGAELVVTLSNPE